MRTLFFIILSSMLICNSCSNPSGSSSGEPESVFTDTFTADDGTSPDNYTWTGDPRGNAEFLIYNNQFTHVSGAHVHYFRHVSSHGSGTYEFDVIDSYWDFAWRIPEADPDSGKCMRLYHRSIGSGWGYVLTTFDWWTLSGYPSGQYMWHNGSHLQSDTVLTGQLTGIHHIRIEDQDGTIQVFVDESKIFDVNYGYSFNGMIGVGSNHEAGTMTPAFDNIEYTEY